MSITELVSRYINERLYEQAYDEALAWFKLECLLGTEFPPDATITIRRPERTQAPTRASKGT